MATPNRHRSHERPAALRRKATPSWLPAFNNGARAVVAFTTHSRSRFSMEALMLLRVALILLVAAAPAWPQSPVIPDTPAGHTLQAWLDAFNSGDRARIQAYIAKYEPTSAVDETVGFRDQTGGFDLLGIDKSERLHIEFRVKEKASPTTAVGKIDVSDADPAVVTSFGLRAIPPGMTAAD